MTLINLDEEQIAVLRTALRQVETLPRPQEMERAVQTEPLDLDITEIDLGVSLVGFDLFSLEYASRKKRQKEKQQTHATTTSITPWIVAMLIVLAFSVIVCYEISTPSEMAHKTITKHSTHSTVKQVKPSIVHATSDSIVSGPTIPASYIDSVLCTAQSPACGTGQALYTDGVQAHIDPAFALAFFQHESTYGKYGMASATLSLGNMRCINGYTCMISNDGGYAAFPSWNTGYVVWYSMMNNLYIQGWGLTTIEQIIPRYAPTADHNNEAAYIASVEASVATYRAEGGMA